ncbi:ANTAR domain-containing protein [Streptomyces monticola]|uniref:ANTAR domain-containing protein n=1 Tax=Streptomyces monticola TaxID=2666263 RepID=A0ABW2JIS2_9ACTN
MSGPMVDTSGPEDVPYGPGAAELRELRLAAAFLEAADTLADDFDLATYLRRLSDHCVELLGARAAGAVLIGGSRGTGEAQVSLAASSSHEDWVLGLLEVQRHGGPCLESYTTRAVVPPLQLARPEVLERWPHFTSYARNHDVTTTYAVPLRRDDLVLGALNLFTDTPHPTTEVRLAQALADAAAIGLTHQRDLHGYQTIAEQLQSALSSRVLIEQAKGMLAERWQVSVDAAFHALRSYARRARLPLGKVAQALLSGALDDSQLPRGGPKRP